MKNKRKPISLFGSQGWFGMEKSIAPGRLSEIGVIKNYPTNNRITAIIPNLTGSLPTFR